MTDTTTPLKDPAPEEPTKDSIPESSTGVDDHHEEDDDLYKESEWDEGGQSHCGYSDTVHETLMTVGQSVHKVVGEPSEMVNKELKLVGNWFQEASYAVRDFIRGKPDDGMQEDTMDAVETMKKDTLEAVSSMMGLGSMDETKPEEKTDYMSSDDDNK